MTPSMKKIFLALSVSALSGVAFIHCGDGNGSSNNNPDPNPATNAPGAATDLGNFNLSCGGESSGQSGQQKQVPFQQQQQSGCKPQKFQFQQQQAVNYDIDLDCDQKRVIVRNKGADQKQQSLPIQSDGTVKGSLQYQQQVTNDNRGNQVCWVEYRVNFDGKAQCGGGTNPTPTATATPDPTFTILPIPGSTATATPTATATAPATGSDKLSLTTVVDFQPSSAEALRQIGVQGPVVLPSATPSATVSPAPTPTATSSPGTSPSSSPSPSPSPSPTASPTATPTGTATPTATPSPTGTPVVVCVVDDPCPIVGKTELSCDQ